MRFTLVLAILGTLHCVPRATSALVSTPVAYLEAARLEPGDAGVGPAAKAFDPSTIEASNAVGLSPDAGWSVVGPGCWLPVASCLEKGKAVADLQAENEQLKGVPHDFSFADLHKAAWVGFALGALTAVVGIGIVCRETTGSVICQR
jgi:hypothetical protein